MPTDTYSAVPALQSGLARTYRLPTFRPAFSRLQPMSLPRNPTETPRNFFQEVHEVVRLIPAGRVTTYGAIAHYLGARHGARMVGYALIAAVPAHGLDDIPAQRVVNRHGLLTGRLHFATPTAMQEALEAEGVHVLEDQVVEFKKLFWDPAGELE